MYMVRKVTVVNFQSWLMCLVTWWKVHVLYVFQISSSVQLSTTAVPCSYKVSLHVHIKVKQCFSGPHICVFDDLHVFACNLTCNWTVIARCQVPIFLLSWPPSFLFSYFVSDIILSLMVLFLQCFIECQATTPVILYYFIIVLTFLVLLLLLKFPFEPLRITDFPDSLSCLSPADHSWSFCWWCTMYTVSSLHPPHTQHLYNLLLTVANSALHRMHFLRFIFTLFVV